MDTGDNNTRPLILIVDDCDLNRETLHAILSTLGYRAQTAENGFAALEQLSPELDLVLLDITMPGIDGFETARRIRRHPNYEDLPIIVVTALDSKHERLEAVRAGANDFIAKPVDLTELQIRIASLLRMKRNQDAVKRWQQHLQTLVEERTAALQLALDNERRARKAASRAELETIYRLALAAEIRDRSTAAHIRRVSAYCGLLAQHLGWEPEQVEILTHASTLHDVGKIAIPEEILRKPSQLAPEERHIIEQHTVVGARLLANSESRLLQMAETIALTHHERWDGTGYPRQLAGTDIPLCGRICAVADVYDALTTRRVYKPAYPREQACDLLRAGRGTHFDPELTDLFLASTDKIQKIQERFADEDGLQTFPFPDE